MLLGKAAKGHQRCLVDDRSDHHPLDGLRPRDMPPIAVELGGSDSFGRVGVGMEGLGPLHAPEAPEREKSLGQRPSIGGVVFLDELTQGLDPGARRVAWNLIEEIRETDTTVVLVTHYMDEAEQLCDRVAVVDRGRLIALGSPQELIARSGLPVTVRFSGDHQDLSWLDRVDGVEKVMRRGENVVVRGTGPVLALVASELVSHGMVPEDLRAEQPDLEDVFLDLTGRIEGRK